jgi:hypothetical protein
MALPFSAEYARIGAKQSVQWIGVSKPKPKRASAKVEPGWSADPEVRSRVEQIAMQAVMDAERACGCQVFDVSKEKCGWDVTSIPPCSDGKIPPTRHIEVKGRVKGSDTVTVTRNEILYGLNQQDKFVLAVVLVDGSCSPKSTMSFGTSTKLLWRRALQRALVWRHCRQCVRP